MLCTVIISQSMRTRCVSDWKPGLNRASQRLGFIAAARIGDRDLHLVGDHAGRNGHRAGRRDVPGRVHDQSQEKLIQLGGVAENRRDLGPQVQFELGPPRASCRR